MTKILLAFVALSMMASAATHESPFACNRMALTSAERHRHFDELGPRLRKLVLEARELPDGYEFQFPGDRPTFDLIAEWTAGEHLCCPFFDISLRLDREGGATWIRLTGRPGTKEFIHSDFRPWFSKN